MNFLKVFDSFRRSKNSETSVWPERLLVGLAILFAVTGSMFWRDAFQKEWSWDFRVTYHAAKALWHGLDPYVIESTAAVNDSGVLIHFSYPYHPYSLLYFSLYTVLPYDAARIVLEVLNIGAMTALGLISYSLLGVGSAGRKLLIVLVILIFGFLSCSLTAFGSGNIAVIESLLVWVAVLGFLRGRLLPFIVIFGIIGLFFRGAPVVMLAILPLSPQFRVKWKSCAIAIAALVLVWFSAKVLMPSSFASYLTAIRDRTGNETGHINPCMFAFIQDVLNWNDVYESSRHTLVYGAWAVLVAVITLLRIRKLSWNTHRFWIVCACLLAYSLIVPRFKIYSYMWFIPLACASVQLNPLFLLGAVIHHFVIEFPFPSTLADYWSMWDVVALWIYLMIWRPSDQSTAIEV